MEKNDVIKNEMAEISPFIAAMDKINMYTVPDHYFDHLSEEIIHRKNKQSLVSNMKLPYQVPADYFNDLSENILHAVKTNEVREELKIVAPLLATIENKNQYSVPPHYFDELEIPVNKEKSALSKVVSLSQKRWVKYAAAAFVAGAVALGGIRYANQGNNDIDPSNVNTGISKLSDNEIMDYLKNHDGPYEINAIQYQDKDIQQSLDSMSEDEIQNYLQTNYEPGETVIKGI